MLGVKRALGLKDAVSQNQETTHDGCHDLFAVLARRTQPISKILQPAPASQKVQVRIGPITVEAKKPPLLRTHIETDSISDKQNADVYVAVALDHAESQVLHGENGGRHLQHVAVLESLTKIGKLEKGKSFARDFQAKLTPALDSANIRIVVFLQEPGPGRVVGAAMQKYSAQ